MLPRCGMDGGILPVSTVFTETILSLSDARYVDAALQNQNTGATHGIIALFAAQRWTVMGMAEYIELTEELILSMRAGARAINNTEKYHGTIFVANVFSENPKQIPYLQAAEILYAASNQYPADVAPVRHGRWIKGGYVCGETVWQCSVCTEAEWRTSADRLKYCPFCGAKMDGGYGNGEI